MSISPPDRSILREAACRAIGEDMGPIDLTTQALVPADVSGKARIFCKESGALSGTPVAEAVFRELDPGLKTTIVANDGSDLSAGKTVIELEGKIAPILTGERPALNFLQHLSGIATQVKKYVDATAGTHCKILDTRKTIPGLRMLQKYAVACGGGLNHRIGLYDAFMVKDNHVALMGGTTGFADAIKAARSLDPDAPLIVEADTLDQLDEFLTLDVDRILLDNMSCDDMRAAVNRAGGRIPLEASGNMTLERIPEVAATGVDFISVGALTHTVRALDFSLEILS
ncbi:MAG: carboxylating nicotinate-nucleotide diphosphorylase [Gammaproteobacteria bacterium]|nr:carboxylating nicotinate-nucleotide diphosphorylase [Gammaproteobacteria bacterium]